MAMDPWAARTMTGPEKVPEPQHLLEEHAVEFGKFRSFGRTERGKCVRGVVLGQWPYFGRTGV